ncbi:MAG: arylsulfatase, partial [Caulobacteraceae bacterium]|nr:arylsulfatase [Caulobacteraceae bacterium]
SRAALLTGRNTHAVHMGSHEGAPRGYPGYDGQAPATAATTAKLLQEAGYGTIALGKWDHTPPQFVSPSGPFKLWPLGQGFDHFYGFLSAEDDQYNPTLWQDNSLIGDRTFPANYFLTDDLADHAIDYITGMKSATPDKPFYMYWATGAAHFPHEAPLEWRLKYRGKFDMGWDKAREMILAREKARGLAPANTRLSPRPAVVPAWSSLTPDQRKLYARQMEVYAAYVSEADQQFGRIVDTLERLGQLDNTLIIVAADNGDSAEGGPTGTSNEVRIIQDNGVVDFAENWKHYDTWGGAGSPGHYSIGWAMAGNTPFYYFKQSAYQGGVHVPAIVSWPARIKDVGQVRTEYHHLIDISPTILAAAHVNPPACVDGVHQQPIDGVDMTYTFDEPHAADRRTVQYYEMWGNRSIYADGWTAVALHNPAPWNFAGGSAKPIDQDVWRLYHTSEDFSESRDLAGQFPDKLAQMRALFDQEAWKYNVFPLRDDAVRPMDLDPGRTRQGHRFEFYGPGAYGFADALSPPIMGRDYTIDALVDMPKDGQGVLAAYGGQEAGYSLYVQNGRLNYLYNDGGCADFHLVSDQPIPEGKVTLSYRFTNKGGGRGLGELLVNGQPAGRQEFQFNPMRGFSAGQEQFNVGRDTGTPVSSAYSTPFAFNGRIDAVIVTTK